MQVYIGYDETQPMGYEVAVRSLLKHATCPVKITPLNSARLASAGLLQRPTDRRGGLYDIISGAPASTDFAVSRFLAPILAQCQRALFVDADVVFMADVAELLSIPAGPALWCVQHADGGGAVGSKMAGREQTRYSRKNWSSVMLFDCDHEANRRLSLRDVNQRRGLDLHQFYWLADSEIGALEPGWNWLVNVQPKPLNPKLAHFTLGTPELLGDASQHGEIWRAYAK